MGEPQARVEIINGQPVLIDPTAEGVIAAVEDHNRKVNHQNLGALVALNQERIAHFVRRVKERGDSWGNVVVTCIQVDDPFGGQLADVLMPGHDWQSIRDRGEMPIARGLASRNLIQAALDQFFPHAAEDLRSTPHALVAVGYYTALVAPLYP